MKVVAKNLAISVDTEEIKSELKEKGIDPVHVVQMKNRENKAIPMYQITLNKNETSDEI